MQVDACCVLRARVPAATPPATLPPASPGMCLAAIRRERGEECLQGAAQGLREVVRVFWRVPLRRGGGRHGKRAGVSEALLPLCCRGFRPALRRTGAREGEEEEGCRLGRVRSVILAKFAAARRQSGVIRAKRGLGGGGEARRGASTPRDASALLWVAVCLDRCQS